MTEYTNKSLGDLKVLLAWLAMVGLMGVSIVFGRNLEPWIWMWVIGVAMFTGFKLLSVSKLSSNGLHFKSWKVVTYFIAWPGMDVRAFRHEQLIIRRQTFLRWLQALMVVLLGIGLLIGASVLANSGEKLFAPWIGFAGLLAFMHFGLFQVVAFVWHQIGVNVRPIMKSPFLATSLADFWGLRWNMAFRDIAHQFVFKPLIPIVGVGSASFVTFLFSGVIHDLMISVPAQGGYGLPTLYFALQGIGVSVTRHFKLDRGVKGRLMMFLFTVSPVALLFHQPFMLNVMVPMLNEIYQLVFIMLG